MSGEPRSSGTGPLWTTDSFEGDSSDPPTPPVLNCACKIPLCQKTSHTTRNPDREYYACSKVGTVVERYACKTWIWVDLVRAYVDGCVKFATKVMRMELSVMKDEITEKNEIINMLEIERMDHLAKFEEVKAKIRVLESSLSVHAAASAKFTKIRRLLLFCVFCVFLAPGSLATNLAGFAILP